MAVRIECVLDCRAQVGESPFWDDRAQCLWWVDIPAGLIHRYDPTNGNSSWNRDEPVGCLAVCESGGLLIATRSGFHRFDPDTGQGSAIMDPERDCPASRFNDGVTDPRGRFWAGTTDESAGDEARGRFYRLDTDGRVTSFFDRYYMTNGLAFSPAGRVMYFSDSAPGVRKLWRCDYDPDAGMPGPPELFFDTAEVRGRPDGGTVDAEGCYWMAGVGGWQLLRLTPSGKIDRIVDLPVERPTKPMFGGSELDVLYLTTSAKGITPGSEGEQPRAGGLFALTGLGVCGVPQKRFAGCIQSCHY